MRFKGLDLNLLHALYVLLEERSVSRAAARLHLSQPAASAALARLRAFFGDELLTLHGKRMIPTSYAETLAPEVKRALGQVDAIISMSSVFDPHRAKRLFRLVASDYIAAVLIAPAIRKFEKTAPGIQLDMRLPGEQVARDFERGDIDLALSPDEYVSPNHPSELLFEERLVTVGWARNPLLNRRLSPVDFVRSAHVAVAIGSNSQPDYAERHLRSHAEGRTIEVYAPSFAVVPWLVIGTRRIAVMHERLAKVVAKNLPIKIQPLPFDIPPIREMIQYHSARLHDSAVAWLRAHLHETAQKLTA
jgi:LysR family transcriptional regulator, nod-box dependent transcriptional activator